MGNTSALRKFRKGDLVMLDPNDPEISRLLEWSKGTVKYIGSRPTTPKERKEWHIAHEAKIAAAPPEDRFSIACDSAGESRLAPKSVAVPLPINRVYIVERARCRVSLGWGRSQGGMTKILDTNTGEYAYVKRDMLKLAESACNISRK